jgi:hypothetical protein
VSQVESLIARAESAQEEASLQAAEIGRLTSEMTGSVKAAGRALSLAVDAQGDRDSAAISTLRLIAFDLAALTLSVEGQGAFLRLLIHDGPREADMAADVYERVFLYVRELEKCFDGEVSFQYILTTTTEPPRTFVASLGFV